MDKRKRYQIFVSSTFTDLKEERGKVMETILNYNCFPVGMEMFPAMDEKQFEYIKRIIDESDYYLLIIGGRYGSVDGSGVSWTEREFDYAVTKGIPVLVFDHEDFTRLPANKTDQGRKRNKLNAFKTKASSSRLIKHWSNKDDLALAVSTSLSKVLDLQPRIGWVRADTIVNEDEQKEIDNLKEELKRKDEYYQKKINTLISELAELKAIQIKQPQAKIISIPGTNVFFRMIQVLSGSFMMGASEVDERPIHKVTLSDYWIGETQVTRAMWRAVMGENTINHEADPDLPVDFASWDDCQAFIEKLNKMTGMQFHLPTEAQWEFAARGGRIGKNNHFRYAGSDDVYELCSGTLHPVKDGVQNELGLYDMSGNVWEWCQDWYGIYSSDDQIDPTGPTYGEKRVLRGGSCRDYPLDNWRVAHRENFIPECSNGCSGLRLAL